MSRKKDPTVSVGAALTDVDLAVPSVAEPASATPAAAAAA
jgi:hypothetical protein